tara:strand:+ start:649 stop:1320 length:672 start_codon:yes stop_codon:yes gene_type:complete
MTLLTEPTRIVLSRTQIIPAVLGEPWGGGYFAGYISHTADGNPTHALIVAPRATGATGVGYTLTTSLPWKTANTTTAGTTSPFDGEANTAAMVTAGIVNHPAADFCKNLSIGGFTDWYFPARYELDIAYFNLKPDTQLNNTTWGANIYAVPQRNSNWTSTYPAQTALTTFNTSAEAFVADFHWSSTEASAASAWVLAINTGDQKSAFGKGTSFRVRAFRRIAL